MLIDEYRKSLKVSEAEEVFDLIFYRPVAFILVKAIYRTAITPNQITTLSLFVGIVSAVAFSFGTLSAALWGAIFYAAANLLDCADGQLARLQQKGTLFGRVWDGIADYLSSVAVFVGIGISFGNHMLWLVVAAGFSSAFHAVVFDHVQSRFMADVNGNRDFLQNERARFTQELSSYKSEKRNIIKLLFFQIYVWYLLVQEKLTWKQTPETTHSNDQRMIRRWSFLGPTTNRTVLIVSAMFGHIEFYLWVITIGVNFWLLICFLMQKRLE